MAVHLKVFSRSFPFAAEMPWAWSVPVRPRNSSEPKSIGSDLARKSNPLGT
jgi:hypothetical protein